jgi:hypothetical protein
VKTIAVIQIVIATLLALVASQMLLNEYVPNCFVWQMLLYEYLIEILYFLSPSCSELN